MSQPGPTDIERRPEWQRAWEALDEVEKRVRSDVRPASERAATTLVGAVLKAREALTRLIG